MRRLKALCLNLTLLLLCFSVHADQRFVQRKDVQQFINQMVQQHQFNRQALTQVMSQVQLQPQIIVSMDKPYEKKNWDVYKQIFVTPERVQGGIEFWQKNRKALERAERQFGVPASVIVAIIGVETRYGKNQGSYRVLDALSTLAFNYPKRSEFFTKELREFLLLCREHKVLPTQYLGSYAGAMGKPQFMPSSYRYYAASFNNNTHIDLMNDDNAVIASVANYFREHGWKENASVAQPAKVTGSKYKKINTANKVAAYQLKQLAWAGVKPLKASSTSTTGKLGLIELTTDEGQEFWMTYPNFYVITRYNSSPQYALAVYLLSQQLRTQWAASSAKNKQFAYA